jgi:hypothetical protein
MAEAREQEICQIRYAIFSPSLPMPLRSDCKLLLCHAFWQLAHARDCAVVLRNVNMFWLPAWRFGDAMFVETTVAFRTAKVAQLSRCERRQSERDHRKAAFGICSLPPHVVGFGWRHKK